MPHEIERNGIDVVRRIFGDRIENSEIKTFDLKLGNFFIEVKSKKKPYANLDFITLTSNQFEALKSGKEFDIFLVCSATSKKPEVFKINSKDLKKVKPRIIKSYEYRKSLLDNIYKKKVK